LLINPTVVQIQSVEMAAINSVVAREALVQLAKRKNFASKNPGVMYVLLPS